VDDEPAVLGLVKKTIENSSGSYEVLTCLGAKEALDILDRESIDCLITDIIMSGMSGYDLIKTLRANNSYADIPILVLTRKRNKADVEKALEIGATDYIVKPIDSPILLDKIDICLKRKIENRQVFSYFLGHNQGDATLNVPCKIVSISETSLILRSHFLFTMRVPFRIQSPIFVQIGIEVPLLRLLHCNMIDQMLEPNEPPYEARFAMVGMKETELSKLRAWVQKMETSKSRG